MDTVKSSLKGRNQDGWGKRFLEDLTTYFMEAALLLVGEGGPLVPRATSPPLKY